MTLTMSGLYPATVTPFLDDLSIDWKALARHIEATAAPQGVKGIVVNGGLGEVLQLTSLEQAEIIAFARKIVRTDQVVLAGIEGRSAIQSIEAGLNAKAAGAQGLLVVPPFDVRAYRRLTRDPASVRAFFAELDEKIDLPMVVFQYPDVSGASYSLEALAGIVDLKNVVAIKAASGTVTRYVELWEALSDKITILPALDSPPLLGMLLHGAHGALIGISVIGARTWADLVDAALKGDATTAAQIHRDYCVPIMDAVFENQEPKGPTSEVACVKEALVQMGQIPSSRVRPPAVDVTPAHREHITHALRKVKLVS